MGHSVSRADAERNAAGALRGAGEVSWGAMHPVNCHHCGAPMQPDADGRLYKCGYCGTQSQVGIAADQIAHGMALDMSNVEHFLGQLARSLQQAVPTQVRIEAAGPRVVGLEVNLDPDQFILRHDGGRVTSQYKKLVRGIALKTKELPLEEWVSMLSQSLARHANNNAHIGALAAQLGGRR
jgi:hypothetical protein